MAPRALPSGPISDRQASTHRASSGGMIDRLLDAAQTLIQQKGYNGFSYDDISQAVGLKKPSIHHYFPRKEDLGASVAQRYTERFEALLKAIDNTNEQAPHRLEAYLGLFSDTYGASRKICPCGILGAEADSLPPLVAQATQQFFHANLAWLTALLTQGRTQETLTYDGPAADMAVLLLSTLEGAMMVGRGLGDPNTLHQTGTAILNNLRTPLQTT